MRGRNAGAATARQPAMSYPSRSALVVVLVALAALRVTYSQLHPTPSAHGGIGEFCNQTSNCSAPHAVCLYGKCSCAVGYEINGTTCIITFAGAANISLAVTAPPVLPAPPAPPAPLVPPVPPTSWLAPSSETSVGGRCNSTANCTINSECKNNVCQCISGYDNNGTACVARVNSTCNGTENCNRNGTYCSYRKCVCRPDYTLSWNGQNCLKKAQIPYDPCTENSQCSSVANTTCSSGVCMCFAGYVPQHNACKRLPCKEGSCNLYGYAQCIGGYCICLNEAVFYNGICKRAIDKIGEKCDVQKNEICYLREDGNNQHAVCEKGICACEKSYKPRKDKKSCVSGAYAATASIFIVLMGTLSILFV